MRTLLCALVVLALSSSARAQENQWALDIELARGEYVLHEPIWLNVTLTNTAADTQRTAGLTAPNHCQFYIELKDSLGNPVDYNWVRYAIAEGLGHLLLGPGERDFASFDLATLFQSSERNSGYSVSRFTLVEDFPFIPKGAYAVRVTYEGAVSDELTLTVSEPFGEEREVLRLIEMARSIWNWNNTEPGVRILREVVERFPNSVFAERCYYLSETYSMEARKERARGAWDSKLEKKKLLEHYPNSGHAPDWIATITRDMDEPARREFLSELAEAHPNTRAAKYARVVQDRMNQQKAGE